MKKVKKINAVKEEKGSKPKYRFMLNRGRIGKKNKDMLEFEDIHCEASYCYELLVGSLCVSDELYSEYVWYDDVCYSYYPKFNYSWFVNSQVLSSLYDVGSVKGYILETKNNLYNNIELQESVSLLLELFITYSKEVLKIKRISIVKYKEVTQWLCYHIVRCNESGCMAMTYSRDSNIKLLKDINCPDFSYSIMIRLISMLKDKGYLLSYVGNNAYDVSFTSMVIFNPELFRLLKLESVTLPKYRHKENVLVEIRKDKKPLLHCEYQEDWMDIVTETDHILGQFNEQLSKTTVTVGNYEIPFLWFTRIFKDSVEECGRLFDDGSIQGKSKLLRSYIRIDGEVTVSLDLKSLHPRLLYLIESVVLEDSFDPYPRIDLRVDTKLINKFKKFYGVEKYDPVRNLCKKMLLCLINAKSKESAMGACYEAISKDLQKAGTSKESRMKYVGLNKGYSLRDIADEILEKNKPIAKYLGSGYGSKLQNIDSNIIMYCINRLVKLDCPVLPIHDALICKESMKGLVEEVMYEGYEHVMGSRVNAIIEEE